MLIDLLGSICQRIRRALTPVQVPKVLVHEIKGIPYRIMENKQQACPRLNIVPDGGRDRPEVGPFALGCGRKTASTSACLS